MSLPDAVLENEGHPAGGADARNGRRREGKADGPGNLAQFPVQVCHDGLVLFLGLLALGPILQGDEEEAAVGVLHLAQHAVADNR